MKGGPGACLRISVIIPCWNDAENLAQLLPALSALDGLHEIVVADASANSVCANLAAAHSATVVPCSAPSRGRQMNAGAAAATGDILLFQHADTQLTGAHIDSLHAALRDAAIVGGAYYRRFDNRHPRLRWLESVARFLTRHGGTLFGDQSVFARRECFESLGGFADIPLMEDVEFSKRLRAAGRIVVLDPPISSSARRHLRRGSWRTSLQNGSFMLLFKFGVSPHRLHAWYYRNRQHAATARQVELPDLQAAE